MINSKLYRAIKYFASQNSWGRKYIASLALKSGFIPQILTIAVTYKCQCSCFHCGIDTYKQDNRQELATEEIETLIKEAGKIRSIVQVTFTGGEPLLRGDLLPLIRTAKKQGFFTKIDSNGLLLSEANLTLLKEAEIDRIDISIDHYDASSHDRLRQCEGLFCKMREALKVCASLSIPCYLQTYATRENVRSGLLEKIIRYAESIKVSRIKIQPPALAGRLASSEDVLLENDDFLRLSMLTKKYPLAYLENEFLDPKDYSLMCHVGMRGNIYVTAYGDILPCCYVPVAFGNVKKLPLVRILKKMYQNELFLKLTQYNGCVCANKALLESIDHSASL